MTNLLVKPKAMSLIGENQPDSYDKLTCKANAISLIGENQPDSYDKLTCKAKSHIELSGNINILFVLVWLYGV
jgi:hypothetical protein